MTDRYILWLQESLNKVLKLRLQEDGSIGSDTRSAVRSFQLKQHLQLSPDGVVCPDTEQALVAAGATAPPGIVVTRGHETPPGRTVYVDIPLQIPLGNANSMTGIFLPEKYCPVPKVDLIVFLHGWKLRSHQPHFSIDTYWHLPEFLLREEVNKSQKNVILVAPTLGPRNEPGSLTCAGGFDKFLGQVMTALKQHGPYAGTQTTPIVGNIILACHSGSWQVMEAIAKGTDTYATQIQEYSAFDPEFMGSMWKNWAQLHPKSNLYLYYRDGRAGQRLCQNLMGGKTLASVKVNCMPNVIAEKSTATHDEVPRVHLNDRIQGAQFLVDKSKCSSSGTRQRASAIREISRFREVPLDLFTDLDGVELWNSNWAEEVWQGEAPRNSPDYIRWVQQSLNQILGLRLAVDGNLGAQTRSAIRSFQQKQGLAVDGKVGQRTEAAIKAALGGLPAQAPSKIPQPKTTRQPACLAFLPSNPSKNYEDYVTAPTTGRITLMINGRNSGGSGPNIDVAEAFDSMQEAVESLGPKDSLFLAAWHFDPTVPLTIPGPSGAKTWGDLFQKKAKEGVKIRIIMTDFDPVAKVLHSKLYNDFLPALNKLIGLLAPAARDNLKYIVSQHPATYFTKNVATHHQKFMIVKKGEATTAFCGGLDIAYMRTPAYWTAPNYQWLWHDIHTKLEGLIALDLEREFVLRWNREKNSSAVPSQAGWRPYENLVQASVSPVDRKPGNNTQNLQMLRTVSVQGVGLNIQTVRRDDIWQGYVRLIGCATRCIYLENQYFREPRMADAIVKQAKAQPELIVIIVVPYQLDDPNDPIKRHGNWLQFNFFRRLIAGIPSNRLRVYTMFNRIIHSKLIMVDDRTLSVGSANANPRSFFLDTELNITVDDAEAIKSFRNRLWSHNLGVPESTIITWGTRDLITQWDAVARANQRLTKTPDQMTGEGIVPFNPLSEKGAKQRLINDVLTEYLDPEDEAEFER